jgi:hypothetical protein
MYDLVDGAGEPDGASNTVNGDEAFDVVAFSGTEVANLIRVARCSPGLHGNRISTAWTSSLRMPSAASPPDPLFRPRSNRTGYRTPPYPGSPVSWSATEVRRLWLYNLYNVGP